MAHDADEALRCEPSVAKTIAETIIISGSGPSIYGVGRLMKAIIREAGQRSLDDVRVIYRRNDQTDLKRALRRGRLITFFSKLSARKREERLWQDLLVDSAVLDTPAVVLIHPQTLGFRWCEQFIQQRRHPTWMYLMDSSFFCLRSYNHIAGEPESCTRCLGGSWRHQNEHDCKPFPIADPYADVFLDKLKGWVSSGVVRCLAQNTGQANLARQHFGDGCALEQIGLWTADWDGMPQQPANGSWQAGQYDVVFHAAPLEAKGFSWALRLARQCDKLKFLFPCKRRALKSFEVTPAPNCHFVPMTWETGLADEVAQAKLVLVPSLWSAPIEGALVKSIVTARAVATVDEQTSFASELPERLTVRLPKDIEAAASALIQAVENQWKPDPDLWKLWVDKFRRENHGLLDRLVAVCGK